MLGDGAFPQDPELPCSGNAALSQTSLAGQSRSLWSQCPGLGHSVPKQGTWTGHRLLPGGLGCTAVGATAWIRGCAPALQGWRWPLFTFCSQALPSPLPQRSHRYSLHACMGTVCSPSAVLCPHGWWGGEACRGRGLDVLGVGRCGIRPDLTSRVANEVVCGAGWLLRASCCRPLGWLAGWQRERGQGLIQQLVSCASLSPHPALVSHCAGGWGVPWLQVCMRIMALQGEGVPGVALG